MLCKGYQYADNVANVQSFSLGQTIPFKVYDAPSHRIILVAKLIKIVILLPRIPVMPTSPS